MVNVFCNHDDKLLPVFIGQKGGQILPLANLSRRLFCLSSSEITLESSDRLRILKALTKCHISLVGVLQSNDCM